MHGVHVPIHLTPLIQEQLRVLVGMDWKCQNLHGLIGVLMFLILLLELEVIGRYGQLMFWIQQVQQICGVSALATMAVAVEVDLIYHHSHNIQYRLPG